MSMPFDPTFFAENRKCLRAECGGDSLIVITANGLLQRGGDTSFPFQQEANFWYLTGVEEPDVILVMDKDEDYLIVPFREGVRAAFDGATDTSALSAVSAIQTVLSVDEGWKRLSSRLAKAKSVYTLTPPPRYIEDFGMYTNPARKRLVERMEREKSGLQFDEVGSALARLRSIKQPSEIAAIQEAIDMTTATLLEVAPGMSAGTFSYEYQIEAAISQGFRGRGARGHAFDPIVAAGKNAATIHYLANNAKLKASQLVVVDVGAELHHYAADITRTFAFGKPTKRQAAVLDAVQDLQAYAFSLLKPGVLLTDYEKEVERYMGKKLLELGLITTTDTDAIRKYYPHAATHHLGLNVHDVGERKASLEPNMVMTVEPGIYIPEESIGVRIEDDVRITTNGIEVLSRALPAQLP
jgi:Xaa-Pro aminopeptidase